MAGTKILFRFCRETESKFGVSRRCRSTDPPPRQEKKLLKSFSDDSSKTNWLFVIAVKQAPHPQKIQPFFLDNFKQFILLGEKKYSNL